MAPRPENEPGGGSRKEKNVRVGGWGRGDVGGGRGGGGEGAGGGESGGKPMSKRTDRFLTL